jgi:hypothetical protein
MRGAKPGAGSASINRRWSMKTMGLSPMSANLSRAAAPRFAHASAGTGAPINDCHTINPLRQCSPTGRFANRLPFKSHSAPRPPQTPAASS